jgi:putrescine aminotransferase
LQPGPDPADVVARYRSHISESIAKMASMMGAHVEVRAEGCYVEDERGERYLDCGGFGVFLLGHRHPAIVQAVSAQLDRQPLPTSMLLNPVVAEAAEKLAQVAPPGLAYSYFVNSGTEAAELAMKLARLAGRRRLIGMSGGFHGKTMGALTVAGSDRYRDPFEPLLPGSDRVQYGDAAQLDARLAESPGECCVFVEPIQGEGGVVIPPAGYLKEVELACRRHGAVLVVDEIQTGLGRTGVRWASESEGVVPDILLAGKALSGGVVPIGAVLATREVFAPLSRDPYLGSSTFGNNPLAGAAAIASIETIEEGRIAERARDLGERLLTTARTAVLEACPDLVREVRGRGLLIGIEFSEPYLAGEFANALLANRMLASFALGAHSVIRLTPPAVMDDEDVAWFERAMKASAETLGAGYAVASGSRGAGR